MRNIREEIDEKLNEIEQKERVKVLYAVESGSRAWGVESPDSDYDVRFIYVRSREDYLRLDEPRDVIEWQLDDVLDINGWDLKKTLLQFHRGNATLFEWANSPVVYKTTELWKYIYENCRGYFSGKAALGHYYGTANSTFEQFLRGEQVKYKKYVYALRPLLACRYIEKYGEIPPVRFEELLKMDMEKGLAAEIAEMLRIKAACGESDLKPRMPGIQKYIEDELQKYGRLSKHMPDDRTKDWEGLNRVFLKVLSRQEV